MRSVLARILLDKGKKVKPQAGANCDAIDAGAGRAIECRWVKNEVEPP
jgi:hypothetical protein